MGGPRIYRTRVGVRDDRRTVQFALRARQVAHGRVGALAGGNGVSPYFSAFFWLRGPAGSPTRSFGPTHHVDSSLSSSPGAPRVVRETGQKGPTTLCLRQLVGSGGSPTMGCRVPVYRRAHSRL